MPILSLKPTHKTIAAYYATLHQYGQLSIDHESAVQTAFQHVLEDCAAKFRWVLVPQYAFKGPKGNALRADGALRTHWNTTMGIWEAKDVEVPMIVGAGVIAGLYRQDTGDRGVFLGVQGSILGEHAAVGAGFEFPDLLSNAINELFGAK